MERLFFSYSRHDKDFVLRLAKDLRSVGVNLWIDQLDIAPGDRWDRGVEEALAAAPAVLVVLSPDSGDLQNVMDEVSLALDEKKRIVPILIRQCNVPFRLRRLQYVDFTAGYDAGLAALVGALNSQRQAGQEQAQTSDGAMPVSSQGPSGFAAPLLNAARVDFDLTRGPRPFPAQVCASRVGSRCCGRGSCACSEAIEPSARARCHTAAVRPRFQASRGRPATMPARGRIRIPKLGESRG